MLRQRTQKNTIRATDVGLHTGEKVLMTLGPAPVNSGIVFRRTDLEGTPEVRADGMLVRETTLGTTLMQDDVRVATVEVFVTNRRGYAVTGLDRAGFPDLADERLEADDRTGERKIMVRHDPARLSVAILNLLQDYALQRPLSVSRAIFREYDVRGVVVVDLHLTGEETLYRRHRIVGNQAGDGLVPPAVASRSFENRSDLFER